MSVVMNAKPLTKLDEARMRALRNGIYHTMRRTFFERVDRLLNFSVIILGTAVAASLANVGVLGIAAAVVGTAQLVWAPGSKARDHAVLQGKFFSLVARAEVAGGDGELLASTIEQELAQIYSEETTTMNAVNALAYNAAQNANGRPAETLFDVKPWERFVANWVVFAPDRFQKRKVAKRATVAMCADPVAQ